MPPRHRGQELIGIKHQVLAHAAFGAQIDDIMRHRRGHGRTIGIRRGLVDHVLQHRHRQLRIHRKGHRQPDALPQRRQRFRLIGQEHDIASLDRALPGFAINIDIERLAAGFPGILLVFQADERAADLQQQVGARNRIVIGRQLQHLAPEFLELGFQQYAGFGDVLAAVGIAHGWIFFQVFHLNILICHGNHRKLREEFSRSVPLCLWPTNYLVTE